MCIHLNGVLTNQWGAKVQRMRLKLVYSCLTYFSIPSQASFISVSSVSSATVQSVARSTCFSPGDMLAVTATNSLVAKVATLIPHTHKLCMLS